MEAEAEKDGKRYYVNISITPGEETDIEVYQDGCETWTYNCPVDEIDFENPEKNYKDIDAEDIIMQNALIRLMPMQITNPEWVAVLTIFLLLPRVLLQQEEIQEAPHGKDISPRIAHALKNLVGLEPVAARRPPRLLLRGVRGYVGKTDELCTPAYNLCPFNPHVVGVNVV